MKKLLLAACISSFALCFSGCFSVDKLPSEDIEVLDKYADTIAILRNEKLLPNSKEKYDAARYLVRHVDLHFTRETKTINDLFYHRDAMIDGLHTETPVFTFRYQYRDNQISIRFFTCRMFVTRVEISEK
ncbi:MAG: hypothetical protein E7051_06970 [Lentisphaerae bacterium]|nr:hypothetical protein [Lentisphaerota bacterium]